MAINVGNEIDSETRVQVLDEAVCISHCSNILDKGMNIWGVYDKFPAFFCTGS